MPAERQRVSHLDLLIGCQDLPARAKIERVTSDVFQPI
jgi:hypothetical protein